MKSLTFGKKESTQVIDENGSTATRSLNIRDGEPVKPSRVRYEIKKRVTNSLEEQEAYYTFSKDFNNDKSKLDPEFRIEYTKIGREHGYYYVVSCYTQLEY